MISLVSFDGVAFESIAWTPTIPSEARDEWDIAQRITPRTGNTSIVAPGQISPRRVTVDFAYVGTDDVRGAVDELLGLLDPTDQNARPLVGLRYDLAEVSVDARVEVPTDQDANGSLNGLRVVFVSEDPKWVETTETIETASGSVSPFPVALTNAGQATVFPVYRIGWGAQHGAVGTVVGQQYRKRMTLTNTQEHTLAPFPYRIALGDTAALVTASKAQADGDDLRIFIDGKDSTRKLLGWNKIVSYAWVTIPGMDAGEVLTIDVVYGNASATDPPEWDSVRDLTRPVPDLGTETGTATGGSTTTLVRASATWEADRWYDGFVTMLTGTPANIGLSREITSNSGTTLTFSPAFPSAVANLDTYLITMSTNARWIYQTLVAERTDYDRGRFNVNSTQFTPSAISYDAPGSWTPATVWDNRDSFGIKRYSMLTMGGSDKDPFALFDAARMWEGNDSRVSQAGTHDGMSLTTPVPITGCQWFYLFDNPNAMAQAYMGVRASGAEDWAEVVIDDTATSGPLSSPFLESSIQTDFGDVYQIVHALGPVNGEEIALDWERDTGSATSGTTTVMTDAAKEWAVDQFDNGYLKMLSGANVGRRRAISSNTSTAITTAAFPVANADGDRYVVTNKRLKATLRDDDALIVLLDSTKLTDSGLGTETAVYDVAFALWVGDDGPAGDPDGQHRVLLGYATNGTVDAGDERRIFLSIDETIEVNTGLRRIRIWDAVAEEYGADLTDPAAIVQWHNGTAWQRSATWLPLGVGDQTVWLEETNIGTLELDISYYASYLGA